MDELLLRSETTTSLTADEAEALVTKLCAGSVRDIGSKSWLQQQESLQRLNEQAHVCARSNTDDFVLSAVLTHQKLPVLVSELVAVEVWREHVLPALLAQLALAQQQGSTHSGAHVTAAQLGAELALRLYYVLYHEATLTNLLEVFMYHDYAVEALEDSLVDLTDYCMRQITRLTSATHVSRSIPHAERVQMLARRVKESQQSANNSASTSSMTHPAAFTRPVVSTAAALSVCLDAAMFGGVGADAFRRSVASTAALAGAASTTTEGLPASVDVALAGTASGAGASAGAAEADAEESWISELTSAALASCNPLPASHSGSHTSSLTDGQRARNAVAMSNLVSQVCAWRRNIGFSVGVTCVTMLRYVSDTLPKLPLSVQTRVLDTHDLPLALVPLIENPPWVRKLQQQLQQQQQQTAPGASKGTAPDAGSKRNGPPCWVKYVDHSWAEVPARDLLKLTPLEGQAWLALYNLLCEPEVRRRYALHSHRKGTLLRVRRYLNETLLNQLPPLTALQRTLDELSLLNAPEAVDVKQNSLLLEAVAEIRDSLIREAQQPPVPVSVAANSEARSSSSRVARPGKEHVRAGADCSTVNGPPSLGPPAAAGGETTHGPTAAAGPARERLDVATAGDDSNGHAPSLGISMLRIVKAAAPVGADASCSTGVNSLADRRTSVAAGVSVGSWSWMQVAQYALTHAFADSEDDEAAEAAASADWEAGLRPQPSVSVAKGSSSAEAHNLQVDANGHGRKLSGSLPVRGASGAKVQHSPSAGGGCHRANCEAQSASSRCSRCHSAWYCSKECQVRDWKSHKEACDRAVTVVSSKPAVTIVRQGFD